jgi:DNA-binding NtrC family response regulator
MRIPACLYERSERYSPGGVLKRVIIDPGELSMTVDKNRPSAKMTKASRDTRYRRGPEKEPNSTARPSEELLLSEIEVFSVGFPSSRSLNEITRELKRFFINAALRRSGGSRQAAARLLGISRYSLKHYMKSLGHDGK